MLDTTDTQLVVVGSSAGGIETLSELISSLPEDFPAPIVIAQHLDPEKESHLKDMLSRQSRLPVQTVTDHEPLQAGVVFVVPANRHVNITDSEIGLSEDGAGRPMPSVDLLLSSAAEVYGERLVAVILTGTGSDGVEGARVVHEAGGTVIIQDPETAKIGGIPDALAPNTVDIVASLDRIGPIISNLLSGVEVSEGGTETEEWSEEELLALKNALAVDLSAVTHLHELSTRLLAASTLRPLLEEVLNATIGLQGADFGNVQLYNQQTGELEIVAQRGFDQEFLDYFSSVADNGDSACGRAMKRRERVIVEDVEADPDYESLRQIAAAAGYRAVQSTPLFNRNGELLGMLSTHFRRPHRPSERELRLTDLYAGQAAEIISIRVVEEALQRQSQLIKTITDNAASCLFMMDKQGHPTFMNPAAEAVTGFTLDEIEDKPLHDAIHHTRPDGTPYPISECPLNRPLLGELPEDLEPIHDHEDIFIRKDGTFFPVSCSIAPLEQDGEIVGAVMDFSDITQRKEAEEALRKSEERFRTFFHTAAVGASQADPATGRFLLVNGKFCQLLGYEEDELLSMTFSQITHPEDRARDAEGLSRLLRGEIREYITEKRYVRKDGRILWVQLARALVRDKDGHPLHTSAIVQDITERKRTEEALRESEELYRLIAENSTDMISKHTTEGVYTYASPACRSLLGYEPQELIGRSAYDFFHPEDLETMRGTLSTILRQPHTRTVTYRIRRKDGSYVWFESTSRTVRDPETDEVQEILAVSRDITERKRAEEERERFLAREWIARAQAEERRRISRELHDRVAHSIAIVHQNLELHGTLKGRDPATAEAKIDSARETAKQALALTRDLSVELRDREVQRGLEAAIKNLARDIVPPTVRCEFPIEGDETLVPLDARNQLFLILREAVRNAVAHSGCDRLTIELDITPQRVAGTVEDNGRGFDADEERSGSGLKSMEERAALLGGTFGVSSEPGAGTKIKVSVPLEDA